MSSLSCGANTLIQPQINSFVVAHKYRRALKTLEDNPDGYGQRNQLLYYLDYGVLLQLASRYKESSAAFEKAKVIYDNLFTVSLTNQASTWLVNDTLSPYRGEDFERVMINIFQAVNFVMLNDIEEALVEARDVDAKLRLVNQQYDPDQKNVYKEDAFARMLMGILYETKGTFQDINDAFISYQKAVEVYEQDYGTNYQTPLPQILKENVLAASQFMGPTEFKFFRSKFPDTEFKTLKQKATGAEVILIEYAGLSPIKHPGTVPIYLPGGYLYKLTFPKYDHRFFYDKESVLKAVRGDKVEGQAICELGEDIGAIAEKNLLNRRVRVITKSLLRNTGKYFLEKGQAENIEREYGDTPSDVFKYVSNVYNIASERPDLRSWQLLPEKINIARLLLQEGTYTIYYNNKLLGEVSLQTGTKKFYVVRAIF